MTPAGQLFLHDPDGFGGGSLRSGMPERDQVNTGGEMLPVVVKQMITCRLFFMQQL